MRRKTAVRSMALRWRDSKSVRKEEENYDTRDVKAPSGLYGGKLS
jgi:hypothetical protein